MFHPEDKKTQARFFAICHLQDAVWSKCAKRVRYALSDVDLCLERTNLFAADGELFVIAARNYNKDVFALLMDHFKKHFLSRKSLELSQPSPDIDIEEEDFDDFSKDILPTPFSVMRDNFEGALHAWHLVLEEPIMAELNTVFADHSSSNQSPPTDQPIDEKDGAVGTIDSRPSSDFGETISNARSACSSPRE